MATHFYYQMSPSTALLFSFVLTANALSDCYFPFLEYRGVQASCSASSDCGADSRCVFSLNLNRRICCSVKPGTVAPKCPSGESSPLVLCSNDDDCQDGASCLPSVTDFTRDPDSPSGICCSSSRR